MRRRDIRAKTMSNSVGLSSDIALVYQTTFLAKVGDTLLVMWFGVWLAKSTELELECMEAASVKALEDRLNEDSVEFVIEVTADSPEQCAREAEKWRASRLSTPL